MSYKTLAAVAALTLVPAGTASAAQLEVLSNRADLISGGDALVQAPRGSTVQVDGRNVTSAFAVRPDGRGPVDQALCDHAQTTNVLPIQVAGQPLAANVLKCRRRPLRRADYSEHGVIFTADQWARLSKVFAGGVCDWSRPGVGQQPPRGSWMSFDVPDGRVLGPPPKAVAVR
jgi:hypothetical protein